MIIYDILLYLFEPNWRHAPIRIRRPLLLLVVILVALTMGGEAWAFSYGFSTLDSLGNWTTEATNTSAEDIIIGERFTMTEDGYADTLYVYLTFADFTDLETGDVKGAIYNYAAGTPSLVDSTNTITIDTSNDDDGWFALAFDAHPDRPKLDSDTTFVAVVWCEGDAGYAIQVRLNTASSGDTVYTDNETFGTWPDPMVESTLDDYTMSIYTIFSTVNTDHLVYDDTLDFLMGQMSDDAAGGTEDDEWTDSLLEMGGGIGYAAVTDSAHPDANGDSPTTDWQKSHTDSNFAQLVNVDGGDTDYWKVPQGVSPANRRTYVDFGVTEANFDAIDSVRFHVRGLHTGNGFEDVIIYFDTSGTDAAFDTVRFTTSATTFITKPITGLSVTNVGAMEGGAQNLNAPDNFTEIHLFRFWCEIFGSKSGSINRVVFAIRNLDSVGVPPGGAGGRWIDSVFLYTMTDSAVGTPGYMEPRDLIPQDTSGSGYGYAVNWATADQSAADSSATWAAWYGAGADWNKAGADSGGGFDYVATALDTVTFSANTLHKIEITEFWVNMATAQGNARNEYNGFQFLFPLGEDSTTQQSMTFGNVPPFSGADSTWIEIHTTTTGALTNAITCEGGADKDCHAFDDTTEVILIMHYTGIGVGSNYDGASARSILSVPETNDFGTSYYFALRDSSVISSRFPVTTDRIDSAIFMPYYSSLYDRGTVSADSASLFFSRRASDSVRVFRWGHTGSIYATARSTITSCFTDGAYRTDSTRSGCNLASPLFQNAWDSAGGRDGGATRTTPGTDWNDTLRDIMPRKIAEETTGHFDVTTWAKAMQTDGTSDTCTWMNGFSVLHIIKSGATKNRQKVNNTFPFTATIATASQLRIWVTDTSTAAGGVNPRRRKIILGEENTDADSKFDSGSENHAGAELLHGRGGAAHNQHLVYRGRFCKTEYD